MCVHFVFGEFDVGLGVVRDQNAKTANNAIPVTKPYLASLALVCPYPLLHSSSFVSRLLTIEEIVCSPKKREPSRTIQDEASTKSKKIDVVPSLSMNVALRARTPDESVMSCFVNSSAASLASLLWMGEGSSGLVVFFTPKLRFLSHIDGSVQFRVRSRSECV